MKPKAGMDRLEFEGGGRDADKVWVGDENG